MIDFTIETNDRCVDFYLRLSRDDRSKGISVSIANQDKILSGFAKANHYTIRHRYIDDGESGYSFDRPNFDRLKEDIASGKVKRLLIKDMSRLGRHNARALLFMEDAKDYGCEVIALDDGYSNFQDNDAAIGIKTWHNELYVKEASRKVKSVIHMKQDDGEWLSTPPYGYRKIKNKTCKLEIEPETAKVVKRIFQMYADDYGILQIARILTSENIPTPSRFLHEMRVKKGIADKGRYSNAWNDQCIRRILRNETYLGTLIQHQGECVKIRGTYQKLPKEKHKLFRHHHEPIIEEELFQRCQEKLISKKHRSKRKRKVYETPFHGILYCASCGSPLKPMHTIKDARIGSTHYYCAAYLKQGKAVCSAKSVSEQVLKRAVTVFLERCRNAYKEFLAKQSVDRNKKDLRIQSISNKINAYKTRITKLKSEIKQLLENKMSECLAQSEGYEVIQESYQSLIDDKIKLIKEYEKSMQSLRQDMERCSYRKGQITSALDVIDDMIAKQDYTKAELRILFKQIQVYDDRIVFHFNGYFTDQIDAVVTLADEKQEAYRQAILKEIEQQAHDGTFSLLQVHQSLKAQGFPYSYKGIFMNHIKLLETAGIIKRPHKNKKAIYLSFCLAQFN